MIVDFIYYIYRSFKYIINIKYDPFYRHLNEDSIEKRIYCVTSYLSSFFKTLWHNYFYDSFFLIPIIIIIISAFIKTIHMKSTVDNSTRNLHLLQFVYFISFLPLTLTLIIFVLLSGIYQKAFENCIHIR